MLSTNQNAPFRPTRGSPTWHNFFRFEDFLNRSFRGSPATLFYTARTTSRDSRIRRHRRRPVVLLGCCHRHYFPRIATDREMHSNMNTSPAGAPRVGKAERKHKVVVIKVGTSSLLRKGHLHLSMLGALAEACSDLSRAGCKVIVVTSGAVGAGCQVLGAVRAPPVSSSPRISSFHPPLVLRGALARGGACRASAKITLRETSGFANAEKATTKRRFRFRSRPGVASAFSRPRPRNADVSSTHRPRPPTNRHAVRTNARE